MKVTLDSLLIIKHLAIKIEFNLTQGHNIGFHSHDGEWIHHPKFSLPAKIEIAGKEFFWTYIISKSPENGAAKSYPINTVYCDDWSCKYTHRKVLRGTVTGSKEKFKNDVCILKMMLDD